MRRALLGLCAVVLVLSVPTGATALIVDVPAYSVAARHEVSSSNVTGSESVAGLGSVAVAGRLFVPGEVQSEGLQRAAVRSVDESSAGEWHMLSDPDTWAESPRLSVDANGRIWAVWAQAPVSGAPTEPMRNSTSLMVASRSPQGVWSQSTALTSAGLDPGETYSLMPGEGPRVAAVWTASPSVDPRPSVREWDGEQWGALVTSTATISDTAYYRLDNGTIAAIGRAWDQEQWFVVGMTWTPGSDRWSDIALLSNSEVQWNQTAPDGAVVGNAVILAMAEAEHRVVRFSSGTFTVEDRLVMKAPSAFTPTSVFRDGSKVIVVLPHVTALGRPDGFSWSVRSAGTWSPVNVERIPMPHTGVHFFGIVGEGTHARAVYGMSTPSERSVIVSGWNGGGWSSPVEVSDLDLSGYPIAASMVDSAGDLWLLLDDLAGAAREAVRIVNRVQTYAAPPRAARPFHGLRVAGAKSPFVVAASPVTTCVASANAVMFIASGICTVTVTRGQHVVGSHRVDVKAHGPVTGLVAARSTVLTYSSSASALTAAQRSVLASLATSVRGRPAVVVGDAVPVRATTAARTAAISLARARAGAVVDQLESKGVDLAFVSWFGRSALAAGTAHSVTVRWIPV